MTDAINNKIKTAKNYALSLLAKREYTYKELKQKLTIKYLTDHQAEQLLEQLVTSGLQSDFRFAESFIRFSVNQNRGQYRIQGELKQKGIDLDIINQAISELQPDWLLLCLNRIEKYIDSAEGLNDFKKIEKLKRYLVYHGFSFDQINQAIKLAKY